MHRLLLDEGIAFSTAGILRLAGVDAVHVKTVGLSAAADPVILEYARKDTRSCVTLDLDFHQLLAASGAGGPSVILLRFQGLRAQQTADLILAVLACVGAELESGIAVTATRRGVRVRRLPIR